jgi:hypothetical protein
MIYNVCSNVRNPINSQTDTPNMGQLSFYLVALMKGSLRWSVSDELVLVSYGICEVVYAKYSIGLYLQTA